MSKLFIGYDARGQKIYLDFKDNPHMHIIGSTRTGKSKLIEWMIRENIKNGEGICLIDPHGFLYDDVIEWCAYHNLIDKKIVLLNPSEGDYVVGFNPFRRTGADLSVQVDNQVDVILRAWGATNTDQTPSLDTWLHNILEAITESDLSIAASEYLIDFYEPSVREYLTISLSRSITQHDWRGASEAKTAKQFFIDHQLLSSKNRIRRFLSPQVRRFMSLKSNNIDIGDIMREGKILLVNLKPSDAFSRENSQIFGALLVNEFFREAFRRKRDEYGNPPRPFYLYIDEFQNFVKTPDLADMLDQVGKFGLRLVLSHQRLGQVMREEEDIIDAVFTNVRNRAIFGGLTRETAKFVAENCFVNQLDLMQIKKAIYQTKFWPVYGRDTVYAKSYGYSKGKTEMSGVSMGNSMMSSATSGMATHTPMGEDWFGGISTPMSGSITESATNMSGATSVSAYSSMSGESSAETESSSEIDIPIFYPVPFKELSSSETWSLEEQLWKMTEALMAQLLRHCFIQIPGRRTEPMLVPFVKRFRVFESNLEEYKTKINREVKALSAAQADELVESELNRLKLEAATYDAEVIEPENFRHPKEKASVKERTPEDEISQ